MYPFSGETWEHAIALQHLFRKQYWLGCAPAGKCIKATCPHLCMEGNDWSACWGEVFQIDQQRGPGLIRIGNVVGLHYPRQKGTGFQCTPITDHDDDIMLCYIHAKKWVG